jgi:hypothetical protein
MSGTKALVSAAAALAISFGVSVNALAAPLFFNGFETDIAGWITPTRVASGTGGITSASGSFHATTAADAGDFTRFGGYNFGAGNAVPTAFQPYITSIDIYLDVDGGWANNTPFDWSSAINNSSGVHLRDFIFNAGFFNDSDGSPGSGTNRFIISASNNSQPGSAYAKNPARGPIAIAQTGWYTFEHYFYDDGGVLAVDMSIYTAGGTLVNSWTLSNPADLLAGVGGNRYGWVDYNKIRSLAIDNSELILGARQVIPEPGTMSLLGLGLFAVAAARRRRR